MLDSDAEGVDEVRSMDARVRELGVTGVPFFILDNRFAVSGAQEPEALVAVIEEALAARQARLILRKGRRVLARRCAAGAAGPGPRVAAGPQRTPPQRRTPMSAVRRMALLSIATSIGTIALKFCAWYLTGSVSLWSDALESFVNLAAGLFALGAITFAHRPADDKHHFGHDKAEYFASGVEGALILVAAAVDHLVGGAAPGRAGSRSRTSARGSSSRSSPGR